MNHSLPTLCRALAAAGLLALVLAGCATPQRITQGSSALGTDSQRAAFERTGRFALNVAYSNGQRDALQGGFAWLDTGQRLVLDLANPMGSTLARIEVTAGSAVVTRSDGSTEEAANADALVEKVLGSPLPVSGLRDWLRGRVGSGQAQNLEKDEQGNVAGFVQDGWRVRLSRYDAQGPALLQMNRNDSSRSISARMVIDG